MKSFRYLFFVATITFSGLIWAGEVYTGWFSSAAVSGYDTVAYFTEEKPVKGKKEFVFKYKGADWYFSSAENLKKFQDNPEDFAPQYGGYCAWAMSEKNAKASTEPENWDIIDGKLYLNYDDSVQKKWKVNPTQFIKKADENWPSVKKK